MEYMRTVPDKYYDLCVCDPPYGIGESGGKDRRGKSKHKKKNWDSEAPKAEYFQELERISSNQIIWGANYFTKNINPSMGWIAWDKKLDNSDFSDFELAYSSFERGAKIFRFSKNGGSRTPESLADIIHPTQKPVKLYQWLLQNYAKPEFKIFDSHLGSGSSAIAAHYFGVSEFVGTELDEDYFKACCERFNSATAQETLF
jgi:site-specific DNA-methyltransferase (adenine-specific)